MGEYHETVVFEQLIEQGAVKRSGVGRPRLRPKRVSGDQGYSSGRTRRYLRRKRICITISCERSEGRRGKFVKTLHCERRQIERCFNIDSSFYHVMATALEQTLVG
ncbi:hypothetical protein OsccyDRAFT_4466 [Leptolyngbyaceae cyanobacterium JSC-12]|nr:hypothetical protein OsccyDRAFT_4466 [Leptolyngbyaceae cyanobacterium JSC-12]